MADAVEHFLNRLHHPALAGIDLSLDRMMRLLIMLGSPHKRLPPVIHVAGTNGKGSLLANLHAIFTAAGLRVHRYTSPHLVHFRERILLNGVPIEDKRLEPILRHMATILTQQPATFFEATTAAAFLAFAEQKADILLLETGLGGRLDATNVIDTPVLTAITPISFDHCEYLGHTLSAIAGEKAGILRKATACVVGKQEEEAAQVIAAAAQKLGAPLYRFGREWEWSQKSGQTVYHSSTRTLAFSPALAGFHQLDNSAAAIACCDMLPQFSLSDAHITQGIASAVWPARLQRLASGAYASMLPSGMELWLDGGHNPAGGDVLAQWIKEQGKPCYLICGMSRNKDTAGYLRPLMPHVDMLYAVAIPEESQSQPPEQICMAAGSVGLQAEAFPTIEKALQTIAGHGKTPAIVCICGSLYLAGKVLAANQ